MYVILKTCDYSPEGVHPPLHCVHRRARVGLVTAALGTPPLIPGHEHLQGGMAFMRPKDVADLRSCRQQLTQAVSHLVLDLHNVKMGLRAKVGTEVGSCFV